MGQKIGKVGIIGGVLKYRFCRGGRRWTKAEVEQVKELLRELTGVEKDLSGKYLEKMTKGSFMFLVQDLSRAGRIAGMATLAIVNIPTGRIGRIEDVVVRSEYRGRGVGRRMTIALIEKARGLGLKRIDLTSNPARVAANKLYKSLKFKKVKTNVYRMPLVVAD